MPRSLQSTGHQLRRCVHWLISNSLRLCGFGGLMGQVNESLSKLQRLESIVEKEIDRLDGYVVYHADRLSEQIDKLNRSSALHANVDALLVTGEFDLLIPTTETDLLSYITRHGVEAIEPGVRAVLKARLRPGSTAVDIGANIGVHALTMAKIVGPGGRVVCIESIPHIASTLERTLRLNGLQDWSQVICTAAANSVGEAILDRARPRQNVSEPSWFAGSEGGAKTKGAQSGDASPTSLLHRAPHPPTSSLNPIPEKCVSQTVKMIGLDEHFAPGERVDLVKVDVKGTEPLVYEGMSRLIRENPEIELIMKWSASDLVRSNQFPEQFLESIRNDGFKPLRIDDERPGELVALQEAATFPESGNILLTRKYEKWP
jgi:FkbM family methyltransferase